MEHKLENVGHLSFKEVSICEIEKEFMEPNLNKVITCGNIPIKILKYSNKSCSDILQKPF